MRLCGSMFLGKRITEIGRARFYFSPVPDTITNQIVGNQARAYHRGNVNLHGCALSVTFANDNLSDSAGLITFSPRKQGGPDRCCEHRPEPNYHNWRCSYGS